MELAPELELALGLALGLEMKLEMKLACAGSDPEWACQRRVQWQRGHRRMCHPQ